MRLFRTVLPWINTRTLDYAIGNPSRKGLRAFPRLRDDTRSRLLMGRRQMSDQDFEYYRRREQEEGGWAEGVLVLSARRAHLAMAEHYAERVRAMMPPMPMPTAA